jgi:hypothetical protein
MPALEFDMTLSFLRTAIPVFGTIVLAACSSQTSDTDARVAELEKKLAETQSQLAQTAPPGTPVEATPAATPPATTPATAGTTAAAPARPTTPPASQKPGAAPATKPPAGASSAEVQRLTEQQQAVNAKQAEANVRLQQENAALERKVEELKPQEFTLPAGTVIPVRTTSELSTSKLSNGSAFDALLERDLVSSGTVLAKAGTRVTGFVVLSDPGGRVKGTASLQVGVRSVVGTKGQVIALTTDSYEVDAASTKKKDAVKTGIATGVGALIGGIAGGGKGAAIGAGVGAGAGVGVNAATRGEPAIIPAEELIEFRLVSPVKIVVTPS